MASASAQGAVADNTTEAATYEKVKWKKLGVEEKTGKPQFIELDTSSETSSKRFYQNFNTFNMISMYNFKGGVGKTTTTFALGCELAKHHAQHGADALGHKPYAPLWKPEDVPGVLIVDLDPQCSLTALALRRTVLKEFGTEDYEKFYDVHYDRVSNWNVYDAIKNVLDDKKRAALEPATLTRLKLCKDGVVGSRDGASGEPSRKKSKRVDEEKSEEQTPRLYLLPGHMKMALASTQLEVASTDHRFVRQLGVLYHLLWMTAAAYNIHTILLDLPPALGGVTKISLLSSHYFVIPFFPDFFSREAVRNLAGVLQPAQAQGLAEPQSNWANWLQMVLGYDRSQWKFSTVDTPYFFPDHSGAQGSWAKSLERELRQTGVRFDSDGFVLEEALSPCALAKRPFPLKQHGQDFDSPGPKFLGGILTKFAPVYQTLKGEGVVAKQSLVKPQEVAGMREMVRNDQDWYGKAKTALESIGSQTIEERVVDPCFVLRREHVNALHPDATARDFPVLEQIDEFYQLAAISQRESCPVHLLQKEHLKSHEANNGVLTLTPLQKVNKHLGNINRFAFLFQNCAEIIINLTHRPERHDQLGH
ncbi:uncharacterized protein MONBRDRAFT_38473 [Monosiga brevicollis MX1]|uniref:AAA domain-containing protein n=1 Tax=Monosiga brevicollis TaxID=81824 RepID=A9V816_MONBE|nr:uncharacterized protein MONBRDRAFT_38473 [Monosiga brevicollis MX1]EDQ86260.1 predicted protein [Monosiga brevicollis MX1]|eukprot:XP_001748930.1 hypothetical protein [Monosiga brevicollis MX1]